MKKNIFAGLLLLSLTLAPQLYSSVSAQSAGSAPCKTDTRDGFCMLQNPTTINSIQALVQKILQLFIYVSYFVCAFFIILTGFKFVTAQGNSDKVAEAGKQLTNVLIGTAIILGLDIILRLIFRTIQSVLQ